MYFFGCSVFFQRTSFCDARYERSGWNDSQISACSARYAENPKKSSLRWFFSSRRESSTRDLSTDGCSTAMMCLIAPRRSVDEVPNTTLAMLHITGLEHENANSCVGFSDIKADVRLTSAKASSNETGLLPEESSLSFALMMSSVRSEIVQACSKDTDSQ